MARKASGPSTRDRGKAVTRVSHNEQTLFKVYAGLAAAGVRGQLAIDAVEQMGKQGVLFREEVTDE